jgi:molecular chaperone DnaK (HSP70)
MPGNADNESLSSLIDQARRLALKTESNTSSSSSRLVIGIDFGTTYTGVGYAIPSSIGEQSVPQSRADADAIIEKVAIIRNWPNAIQQSSEKIQTLLAYDNGQLIAWGGRVKSSHQTRVSYFKLGLQENVGEHYKDNSSDSKSLLGGSLRNLNWKHESLPNKSAVDFAADYLTAIRQYVVDVVLPSHFGEDFLNNQQFSYVLTVPAIWTDKAKDLTRKAALAAGISDDKLKLITEPEAAALYCATICVEVGLRDGDRFLVCDAGGGTVVMPKTYMFVDIL